MSGAITIRSSDATKAALSAWRQRGYNHGAANPPPKPPPFDDAATAYMMGYRRGAQPVADAR